MNLLVGYLNLLLVIAFHLINPRKMSTHMIKYRNYDVYIHILKFVIPLQVLQVIQKDHNRNKWSF